MRTWLPFLAASFLFIASACAHVTSSGAATPPKPYLAGLDIYGTDRTDIDEIRRLLGGDLDRCLEFFFQHAEINFKSCQNQLGLKIQNHFQFASAQLSAVQYFDAKKGSPVYITFDVVEPAEQSVRMRFLSRPTGTFEDPDGLLKAWDDYFKLGFELMKSGEITGARVDCPAFHCIFGHKHPKLAPYESIFVKGVPKNESQLKRIFSEDKDDLHRGTAAFLLAYSHNGTELVQLLSSRLNDESDLVRNNVLRVFSDISSAHREIALPMGAVISALDLPATTDRNKASFVILNKAVDPVEREKYRDELMRKAVPIFLRTLRLKQPNNHDISYLTLKFLSGAEYGEFDYDSWEKWYQHAASISDRQTPIDWIRAHAEKIKRLDQLPQNIFDHIKNFKVLTIGEMHGTNESQSFVLGLARLFNNNSQSMVIGLEIDDTEQSAIDRFLKTGDLDILKNALFFRRTVQDGRSSEAMARLLTELRKFPNIKVICYDPHQSSSAQARDTGMAVHLAQAYKKLGRRTMIVLAGNVHSKMTVGAPWDSNYRPMAYELLKQKRTPFRPANFQAVKIRYHGGEGWVCMTGKPCGISNLTEPESNYSLALPWSSYFVTEKDRWDGYGATVFVKWLTASPPLVQPASK